MQCDAPSARPDQVSACVTGPDAEPAHEPSVVTCIEGFSSSCQFGPPLLDAGEADARVRPTATNPRTSAIASCGLCREIGFCKEREKGLLLARPLLGCGRTVIRP